MIQFERNAILVMVAYVGYLVCMIQYMFPIERPIIQPWRRDKEQECQELLIELQANNNSWCVIGMNILWCI
jgi:hypothetical protein